MLLFSKGLPQGLKPPALWGGGMRPRETQG